MTKDRTHDPAPIATIDPASIAGLEANKRYNEFIKTLLPHDAPIDAAAKSVASPRRPIEKREVEPQPRPQRPVERNVSPYRSLYESALAANDRDRAWCSCAAMAFVGEAAADELRIFEEHRPRDVVQLKTRLDNEHWIKNLFHEDDNIFIGKVFEMVTPAAIVAKTTALKTAKQLPRLDKRFKQDPSTTKVYFAQIFGWAAQVLGLQTPELYVREDVPGGLITVPARPPASVAGAHVLTGTPQELAFIAGKHLAAYRGEHYMTQLFPTLGELTVIMFGAIRIIQPDFAIPPAIAEAVDATATELERYIQPVERESLHLIVDKLIEARVKIDLPRWMRAVEVTAARAGFLVCGDLAVAKKILEAERAVPSSLSPTEMVNELLAFSVSDQYAALRKALGIAITG